MIELCIATDNLRNNFLCLYKKCDVVWSEYIIQKVWIYSDNELTLFLLFDAVPDAYQFLLDYWKVWLLSDVLLNNVVGKWLCLVGLVIFLEITSDYNLKVFHFHGFNA